MDETGKARKKREHFLKHGFLFLGLFGQPLADLPGAIFQKDQAQIEDVAVFPAVGFGFKIQKGDLFRRVWDFIQERDGSWKSKILKDHRKLLCNTCLAGKWPCL